MECEDANMEEEKKMEHSSPKESLIVSEFEDRLSEARVPGAPKTMKADKSTSNKLPPPLGLTVELIEHFIYLLIKFGLKKVKCFSGNS